MYNPAGSTRFMLMMDLDMDYEEAYEDPESNISKDLATRIQQQVCFIDTCLRECTTSCGYTTTCTCLCVE